MPGLDSGSVGFDRPLLEHLRRRSVDAIDDAERVRSTDWHAVDAISSLTATVHFLRDVWLPTIDELLSLEAFTRTVNGTDRPLLADLPDAVRAAHEARRWSETRLLVAVVDIGRLWPTTKGDRRDISDLDARDRGQLAELLRRIDADPSLLDRLIDDPDAHLLHVLATAALDGHLDAVAAIRLAAAITITGTTIHASPSDQARHDRLLAGLHDRLDELAADPIAALDTLEHPEVREWLVLQTAADPEAIAAFVGAAVWTATQVDPSSSSRSLEVWLDFIELADQHASTSFSPGLANGLAIGAVAYLTDVTVTDLDLVTTRSGTPIHHDGVQLTDDQLHTLLGAIVAVPSAAGLLAEFVERTAIADIRDAVTAFDTSDLDAERMPSALRESTARANDLLDLVFDDSIDHHEDRWAAAAAARADDRSTLVTTLNTLVSIVPAGVVLTGTTKTLIKTGVTTVTTRSDDGDRTIPVPDAATLLDTQLAVQVAVSIAESPALRTLVDFDHLQPETRAALRALADDPPSEITDLRALLVDLIGDERSPDFLVVSGTIHDIVGATTAELEPHRD